MSLTEYLIFFGCIGVACFAQNLTGFAFGLIFLGLISLFGTMDLLTAANVISILSLANALPSVKSNNAPLPKRAFAISLATSLCGVVFGLYLLHFMSHELERYLKALLALTIIIASFLLITQRKPPERLSAMPTFVFFGGLSGVLGGLFSTAGPPLVYLLYKQPLSLAVIKRFLVLSFAANAVLRIILVTYQGGMSTAILLNSALAFPFVYLLTLFMRKHPIKWPLTTVKKIVFCLLLLTAFSLLLPLLKAP